MRWFVLVNVVALVAAAAWLAWLTMSPGRAIRARNAFLLRRGGQSDFAWTPESVPDDFRQEHAEPPLPIAKAVEEAGIGGIDGDWARACALVGMLVAHAKADAPIRADLVTTFKGIVEGGGYCADYVRVYLAAARTAGLFCRQWAFSFDGFGGHGHTVIEVWDRAREQWAMIDVHNNVFATRRGGDAPLDVAAIREALLSASVPLEFKRVAEGRLGYPIAHKLVDYYRRGAREWYLWFGNDVVTRERQGLTGAIASLSGRLAHRMTSVSGRLPPIIVLVTPDNERAIARMERLRRRIEIAAFLVAALVALLIAQRVLDHG